MLIDKGPLAHFLTAYQCSAASPRLFRGSLWLETMRHLLASVLTYAFLLAVVGCSKERSDATPPVVAAPEKKAAPAPPSPSASGDEPERLCSAKSICPAEVIDAETAQVCASLARDPVCGAKFLALVRCQIAKEKCGADGKTDQQASMDLCKAEDAVLNDCVQAKAAAAQPTVK